MKSTNKESKITLLCENALSDDQKIILRGLKEYHTTWLDYNRFRKQNNESRCAELYEQLTNMALYRDLIKQDHPMYGSIIYSIFFQECEALKLLISSDTSEWERVKYNYLFLKTFIHSPNKSIAFNTKIVPLIREFNQFRPWRDINNKNEYDIKMKQRSKDPVYNSKCLDKMREKNERRYYDLDIYELIVIRKWRSLKRSTNRVLAKLRMKNFHLDAQKYEEMI